jgi:hypothetical protein
MDTVLPSYRGRKCGTAAAVVQILLAKGAKINKRYKIVRIANHMY